MNDDQASYESEEFDRNLADLTAPDDVTPGDAAPTSDVRVTTNNGQVAGNVAGDQIQTIISNYIRRLRRAYDLTPDIVGEIVDTFVDRDFESMSGERTRVQGVIEILRERRCVVLLGEPGVGRRNAAVKALAEFGLPLRQLPTWDPALPDEQDVFDHPADTGRAFLLMAPDEGSPPTGLVAQIAAFGDELSEAGSLLIVATTTSMWAAAGGYHDGSVLVVGPPDGHELLRKRVAFVVRRPDVLEAIDDQQIGQHAKTAAPDEVTRLAELLIEAARRTPEHLGSPEPRRKFVDEVIHAYLRWEAELGEWFQNRTDAADRLFLLAVAALEGSPAPVVLRAAEDLGVRLGLSRLGISGIESAGIRQLAKNVQAEVRPDTTIHFKRPAYRTAVLDFVLSDRSEHLRRALQRWLADLPSPNSAPKVGTAIAVAEVVLDLARRHRDVGFPIAMVAGWKRQERLRDVLAELLTAVALSPETGGPMRRRLYIWSRQADPDVLRILVQVCTGVLADAYPGIAVTRINNAAVRAAPALFPDLVDALAGMWERPSHRRAILGLALGWLSRPADTVFGLGAALLVKLASPEVDGEPIDVLRRSGIQAREQFGTALQGLLYRHPAPAVRDLLYAWFDRAAADHDVAQWLIGTFVLAVEGPGSALRASNIRVLVDTWHGGEVSEAQAGFREQLVVRVLRADPMIWPYRVIPLDRGGAQDASPQAV